MSDRRGRTTTSSTSRGGFLQIRVGGSFAVGKAKVPSDGEHRFHAYVDKSSLAYGAALKAARSFLDRLEENLPVSGWSAVGIELAEKSGLVQIPVDTLRDTPAGKSLQRGEWVMEEAIAAVDDDLVEALSKEAHEARIEARRERGRHSPGECGDLCADCDWDLIPWENLPTYVKQEECRRIRKVLYALHDRGLLP